MIITLTLLTLLCILTYLAYQAYRAIESLEKFFNEYQKGAVFFALLILVVPFIKAAPQQITTQEINGDCIINKSGYYIKTSPCHSPTEQYIKYEIQTPTDLELITSFGFNNTQQIDITSYQEQITTTRPNGTQEETWEDRTIMTSITDDIKGISDWERININTTANKKKTIRVKFSKPKDGTTKYWVAVAPYNDRNNLATSYNAGRLYYQDPYIEELLNEPRNTINLRNYFTAGNSPVGGVQYTASFTANSTYKLTNISIGIYKSAGYTGTITYGLYTAAGNKCPNSLIIKSNTSLDVSTLATGHAYYNFVFNTTDITNATTYVIAEIYTSGSHPMYDVATNTGQATCYWGGASWALDNANRNWNYKVYGIIPTIGNITNLLNISQTNQSIAIQWTNPTGLNHTRIYYNKTSGGTSLVFFTNITNPNNTTNITGLQNNTEYTIYAVPVGSDGLTGEYTTLTTKTSETPPPPAGDWNFIIHLYDAISGFYQNILMIPGLMFEDVETSKPPCDSGHESLQIYNYTSHKMQYCNSTAWVQI